MQLNPVLIRVVRLKYSVKELDKFLQYLLELKPENIHKANSLHSDSFEMTGCVI